MRRIVTKNRKKALREQALRQFRETERKLKAEHPEMMEALKRQILKPKDEKKEENLIPVDRCKNLETIMKYLENAPDQDELRRKLQTLLS